MGDPAIDALQDLFRPTLESNRKEFQGRFTRVQGFRAGAGYPQLWVRDSSGLAPLSRWLYPRGYLTSWLEEMLAHQQPDGALFDWIAAGELGLFKSVGAQCPGAVPIRPDRDLGGQEHDRGGPGDERGGRRLAHLARHWRQRLAEEADPRARASSNAAPPLSAI